MAGGRNTPARPMVAGTPFGGSPRTDRPWTRPADATSDRTLRDGRPVAASGRSRPDGWPGRGHRAARARSGAGYLLGWGVTRR